MTFRASRYSASFIRSSSDASPIVHRPRHSHAEILGLRGSDLLEVCQLPRQIRQSRLAWYANGGVSAPVG